MLLRRLARNRNKYRSSNVATKPVVLGCSSSQIRLYVDTTIDNNKLHETKPHKVLTQEKKAALEMALGIPVEHLTRHVLIRRQARVPNQQGWKNARGWEIEFSKGNQWTNPLMGWTSGNDPLSQVKMNFDTKDQAISYAEELGFDFEVENHSEYKLLKRNERDYGFNFRYKAEENDISDDVKKDIF
eukprot:TRINITY_DN2535_c0_g1_i1.p1 TRINITY_DN2535_c0_g1~~TRINITY_DN2535_c0_g1_i1.p1  ORF type:complete len:186 (+),score=41.59 TRINITY_DN2535_c0_g1_i1:32-589(+)